MFTPGYGQDGGFSKPSSVDSSSNSAAMSPRGPQSGAPSEFAQPTQDATENHQDTKDSVPPPAKRKTPESQPSVDAASESPFVDQQQPPAASTAGYGLQPSSQVPGEATYQVSLLVLLRYLTLNFYQQQQQQQQSQMFQQQQQQQNYSQQHGYDYNQYSDQMGISTPGASDTTNINSLESGYPGPSHESMMYSQGYGQAPIDPNMMQAPPPGAPMGDYGAPPPGHMPMHPYDPYDDTFAQEPSTKRKGKGRPKKDPSEPKKEKKPRAPRAPRGTRGRGRGARATGEPRMPPPPPMGMHEGYDPNYPPIGMEPGSMYGPPPGMMQATHKPPPHPQGPPPGMMMAPGAQGMPPHGMMGPGMMPGQMPPGQVPMMGGPMPPQQMQQQPPPPPQQISQPAPQPPQQQTAQLSLQSPPPPPRPPEQQQPPPPPQLEQLPPETAPKFEGEAPPSELGTHPFNAASSSSSVPKNEGGESDVAASTGNQFALTASSVPSEPSAVPTAEATQAATSSNAAAGETNQPQPPPSAPPTAIQCDEMFSSTSSTSFETPSFALPPSSGAEESSQPPVAAESEPAVEQQPDGGVLDAEDTQDEAPKKAKKRKKSPDGSEKKPKKTKKSRKKNDEEEEFPSFEGQPPEEPAPVQEEPEAAEEEFDPSSKGKAKGKGKGGSKKPKLKETKSKTPKKKLPKFALKFSKNKKKRKRLGSSDNSDLERTPPPSPDEAESGILKRRSARNTKRQRYTDEIAVDLSDDESKLAPKDKNDEDAVSNVVANFDDAMVVEKIMASRDGNRELEQEPKKEEGDEKKEEEEEGEEKPPTKVQVEEYYVKYKNLSYLHCDWRTEEELERGDKRIAQKIKRFKQKKDSSNAFDFLDDEPFNPDYCEVDRILDWNQVEEATDASMGIVKVEEKPPENETETEASEKTDQTNTPESEQEAQKPDGEPEAIRGIIQEAVEAPKKKMVNHYLVKWQALPYDECNWELEDDLDATKVANYWKFKEPPPKDRWKPKRRPKPHEWTKLPKSPVYKSVNTLREYQLEGLNWLMFCWHNSRNCILADEMGLGKTIQSLAFVSAMVEYGVTGPFLVIAPLSTIGNWQREFETWTELNVITYHGSGASRNMIQEYEMYYRNEAGERVEGIHKFHVMITTFEIVLTDCLELREIQWRACIIDEAHRLKNRNCKLLEGLRLLSMEHRVLLTGTPLQNNVEELFSLLNFLEPNQFPSSESFLLEFGDLKTEDQVDKLKGLLKPMMLRRLKEDVEKSLAPKEETIIEVSAR